MPMPLARTLGIAVFTAFSSRLKRSSAVAAAEVAGSAKVGVMSRSSRVVAAATFPYAPESL